MCPSRTYHNGAPSTVRALSDVDRHRFGQLAAIVSVVLHFTPLLSGFGKLATEQLLLASADVAGGLLRRMQEWPIRAVEYGTSTATNSIERQGNRTDRALLPAGRPSEDWSDRRLCGDFSNFLD
jgi:hypothetical protein